MANQITDNLDIQNSAQNLAIQNILNAQLLMQQQSQTDVIKKAAQEAAAAVILAQQNTVASSPTADSPSQRGSIISPTLTSTGGTNTISPIGSINSTTDSCVYYFGNPYWSGCNLYIDIICDKTSGGISGITTTGPGAKSIIATIDISQFLYYSDCVSGKKQLKFDAVTWANLWDYDPNNLTKISALDNKTVFTDTRFTSLSNFYNSSRRNNFTWKILYEVSTSGDLSTTLSLATNANAISNSAQAIIPFDDAVNTNKNCEIDCGKTGGGDNPCNDTWNLKSEVTEEEFLSIKIPTGYFRIDETGFREISTTTNTDSELSSVPNNACYVGFRQVTVTTSASTFTYQYQDSECVFTHSINVLRTQKSEPTWVSQRFDESKRNLKECQCEELYEEDSVLNDPTDPCGCKQYNIVRVKIKCPGDTEFRYSTETYTEGLPSNIVLPPGRRLDPFIPFSVRGDCQEEAIKIYHPLILGKDIVDGKVTANTRGLFNLSQSMSCYITSSSQPTASKGYYYEVTDCDCNSTPYFAVAYGNVNGSGSIASTGETNDTATRAIYSQYRLLALDEPERKFKFYSSGVETESDDIYAINFYRTGLSDRIDPGNFEVALRPLNGSSYANSVFTGSNVQPSGSTIYTFIDNSDDRSDLTSCTEDPYVSYDIVSGSLDGGIHSSGTGASITTYGKFYPNLGIMVFDPAKMNSLLKFNTVSGSNIAGDNAMKLFTSISGSGVLNAHMKARNVKYKTTNHYFVRVSPPNSNYSNNPTFTSDLTGFSSGKLRNACFQKDPVTYVTSVGLYNDKRELLAVAKLSKPIKKTSDDDLLIKIRLNW
jgi:hypothetical protein